MIHEYKTICMVCVLAGACLADPGAAFRRLCGEKAEAAMEAGTMTVAGVDDWLFLANELRHLSVGPFWGERAAAVSRAAREQDADPLPAILDFHRQLAELGIELLLVPVPAKATIYPDKLAGGEFPSTDDDGHPPRLDDATRQFYDLLRREGVPVLDLSDAFLARRFGDDGPLYCRQDSHWSGTACNLAAARIAEVIKQRDWYADSRREEFLAHPESVEISGDLRQALPADQQPPRETVALRRVATPAGEPVAPDRNSPVILLGDSHTLVFQAGGDMHADGAGLADQLAYELGFAVDLVGVRGSGATPARINLFRRGRSAEGYFTNKKIIVWCFAVREFSESHQGWRLVPVVR